MRTEKRTELRCASDDEVRIRPTLGSLATVAGRLVDVADRGFRARHQFLSLASGQVVDFEFAGRSGLARAIWTRIAEGHAETGFRIMDSS